MKKKTSMNEKENEMVIEEATNETVAGHVQIPEMRLLTLYGDVDEKKAAEITYSLLAYKELKKLVPLEMKEDSDDIKTFVEIVEPLDFLISTNGGSASDMFAIYDVMSYVKNTMPIHTIGIGKVMSAGVLLLASGTKGQRKIGKNCRVMLHAVIAGAAGPSHDVLNEVEEIMATQEKYIKCLAEETDMTIKQIKKLIDEKKNIYLNADEAVRYGIADLIL